uniref:Uncharacterized protein n=1 Tax=Anguilla anguilla TaxID=7936 RepID=A0A0E9VNV1_ANGAN
MLLFFNFKSFRMKRILQIKGKSPFTSKYEANATA